MANLRVAAAQIAPVFLDRDGTIDKVCQTIATAAGEGARLIVFPEAIVPGYPYWLLLHAPLGQSRAFNRTLMAQALVVPSSDSARIAEAARAAKAHVLVGASERVGATLYNAQLLFGPDGALLGKRHKLTPTGAERMIWGAGGSGDLAIWPTAIGCLGALMCYEHVHPLLCHALHARGEQIHMANWPGGLGFLNAAIDAAVRYYALSGAAFVVSATSVMTREIITAIDSGGAGDRLKPGGGYSAIIGPGARMIAGPAEGGETVLYADLDLAQIDEHKLIADTVGHYDRPDIVRLWVQRDAAEDAPKAGR